MQPEGCLPKCQSQAQISQDGVQDLRDEEEDDDEIAEPGPRDRRVPRVRSDTDREDNGSDYGSFGVPDRNAAEERGRQP